MFYLAACPAVYAAVYPEACHQFLCLLTRNPCDFRVAVDSYSPNSSSSYPRSLTPWHTWHFRTELPHRPTQRTSGLNPTTLIPSIAMPTAPSVSLPAFTNIILPLNPPPPGLPSIFSTVFSLGVSLLSGILSLLYRGAADIPGLSAAAPTASLVRRDVAVAAAGALPLPSLPNILPGLPAGREPQLRRRGPESAARPAHPGRLGAQHPQRAADRCRGRASCCWWASWFDERASARGRRRGWCLSSWCSRQLPIVGDVASNLPIVGGGASASPLSALRSLPVVGGLTSGLPVVSSGGAGSSPLGAVGSLPVIGGLACNLPIVGGGAGASPLNALGSLPVVG